MKSGRPLLVHLALVAVAGVFAILMWTRDKQPKALAAGDVTVWSGRPSDVERISYEGKNKKLVLEPKKDAAGTYLIGTFEKQATAAKAPDAGADAAPPSPTATTVSFVSVGAGQKLLEAMAPLKVLRSIGRIADDRAAEFGLAEPEGTILLKSGGTERKMIVGGATPGDSDRYVKDPASGEVYVLKGDIFRDLDTPDQRLVERDLHEWKEADVAKATVTAGGKKRELVRGSSEGKKFWADPQSADKNDETAGNWMSKLDRLRPTEFSMTPPEGKEVVARVDYQDAGRALGFLELVKVPGTGSAKADYYVLSERTRNYAKVAANQAEQVEQDVGAIAK